jgi:putative DNA primase/helicase
MAGSLEGWREGASALCQGNSRLVLAVAAAFAAPLLDLVGDESGGVHLVGGSSTGKTTALRMAASVWGGPEFVHRWRATANGLEAVAQGHNDALLVLDELAQVDPREAGEIAYMLANGSGKHRARRDGLARRTPSWRLLFLSAGEVGLSDHMAAVGKRSRAGQEVRLVDVPADAGAGLGLFEDLHGHADGAAMADAIARAARTHYGAAARAYLRSLVESPREALARSVEQLREDFTAEALPPGADGQARRVAARFGLIAAGGELATALGVTGWPAGEAINAAAACYRAWMERRGGVGPQEDAAALAQVQHFIEAHGAARFVDLKALHERPVSNRAGYLRRTSRGLEYLILRQVFRREVCQGLDYRSVARVLRDRGLLLTEAPDRLAVKVRGIGRVYAVLDPNQHEVDSDAA